MPTPRPPPPTPARGTGTNLRNPAPNPNPDTELVASVLSLYGCLWHMSTEFPSLSSAAVRSPQPRPTSQFRGVQIPEVPRWMVWWWVSSCLRRLDPGAAPVSLFFPRHSLIDYVECDATRCHHEFDSRLDFLKRVELATRGWCLVVRRHTIGPYCRQIAAR